MQKLEARQILPAGATLGEGCTWDDTHERLLWVDIPERRVHFFDPKTGANRFHQAESEVGCAHPTQAGDLILGTRQGLVRLDAETGAATAVTNPLEGLEPPRRFNDGKPDARGRLWVGTITDDRSPSGHLYRIGTDGSVAVMLEGVINSNGLAWSLDNTRFYYIDTGLRRIDAFDFDVDAGTLGNRRTVVEVPEAMGKPDGMCIDNAGMLWTALFGGSGVARWNPETGEQVGFIGVHAENVTCCCFGGKDYETLYITTHGGGGGKGAGHLHAANPGVSGPKPFVFGG